MKISKLIGLSSALCLSATMLQAQETNEVELLKRQLQQATENFDKMMKEQRQVIDALNQRLDNVLKQQAAITNEQQKVRELVEKPVETASTNNATIAAAPEKPWSPSDPIMLFGGKQSYLNISFDGLFAAGGSTANDVETLETGDHDPLQNGFTVQNLELALDGAVDPYFRGQANIVLKIDPEGETTIEAEEAYLETVSLPWNLQVKAGQFLTEFGRFNPTHPHAWAFVDQPLVSGRMFGPEQLRSAGARVSWLAPTPFYSEFLLAIQNSQGETAFSFNNGNEGEPLFGRLAEQRRVQSVGDMMFTPRYAASFDVSDTQTIVAGTSAVFGPNATGDNTDTQIYGVDLFWKWKPVNSSGGFPFVSWQTEGMLRKFRAGAFDGDLNGNGVLDPGESAVPRETLTDYGVYSQVAYGFKKGWVAALRGDYVGRKKGAYENILGPDPDRAERWRISPNLTWYPSEFSKIRLQWNTDHRADIGMDYSVWLQFEFLLGAHAAHKF